MKGKFDFTKKTLKMLDNLKQFNKKVTSVTSEDSITEDDFVMMPTRTTATQELN